MEIGSEISEIIVTTIEVLISKTYCLSWISCFQAISSWKKEMVSKISWIVNLLLTLSRLPSNKRNAVIHFLAAQGVA